MNLSFHENHRLLFGTVLFGFLALSFIIAVSPAVWVQNNTLPLPGSRALSAAESNGLAIYIAEGCAYCHTQQVRPLDLDKPFGRPSAPGDYARLRPQDIWRMTPEMTGTERTGPDLSNMAARQPSDTWNYIHLYNPRAVVGGSVMQAYPWLFTIKVNPGNSDVVVPVPPDYAPKNGKLVATQEAKDLVAYLLSLRQVTIAGATTAAQPQPTGKGEAAGQGAAVYACHCASCHGATGEGVPGVFPPMKGDPMVTAKDPARHMEIVLFGISGSIINGVRYSAAMPEHAGELSDTEIAAVVNHERTSWGNNAPTITPADVAAVRKKGKQ